MIKTASLDVVHKDSEGPLPVPRCYSFRRTETRATTTTSHHNNEERSHKVESDHEKDPSLPAPDDSSSVTLLDHVANERDPAKLPIGDAGHHWAVYLSSHAPTLVGFRLAQGDNVPASSSLSTRVLSHYQQYTLSWESHACGNEHGIDGGYS